MGEDSDAFQLIDFEPSKFLSFIDPSFILMEIYFKFRANFDKQF
jgi:hypothetical protein